MKSSQRLLVPVRTSAYGTVTLLVAKLPTGERVGLAFTCEETMAELLGPDHGRIIVHENFLRCQLAEIGVTGIQVDATMLLAPVSDGQPQHHDVVPAPAATTVTTARTVRTATTGTAGSPERQPTRTLTAS
ncbi:SAV_915 family protein [Actinopolymorpha pittospori]